MTQTKHNYKILHIPTGNFILVVLGVSSRRKMSDRLLTEWLKTTQATTSMSGVLLYGFYLGTEYLPFDNDSPTLELVSHKKEILEKILNTKSFRECIIMDIYNVSMPESTTQAFNAIEFEIVEA
jgi:hypothetical protein